MGAGPKRAPLLGKTPFLSVAYLRTNQRVLPCLTVARGQGIGASVAQCLAKGMNLPLGLRTQACPEPMPYERAGMPRHGGP
jgi:hypothetical protein